LICLKAKAYLEIADRIAKGGTEDKKHLKKHKADVFRMAVMMNEGEVYELPDPIKEQLRTFMKIAAEDLPDKAIFKEMGLGNVNVKNVYDQLMVTFQLEA